jgi:CD109 antigen
MTSPVSRRVFLAASATGLSVVACHGPILGKPMPPTSDSSLSPTVLPIITPVAGGASPFPAADGYVAVAPRVLRSGQREAVSFALFRGDRPATDLVTVTLGQAGSAVATVSGPIAGRGALSLAVPDLPAGDYDLRISAKGFQDHSMVRVEDGTLYFLETDKPIYKPGQTVHIRLLALDPNLKPAPGEAILEIMDGTGTKIYRKKLAIDAFGMGTVDLPLSDEPNLGVWKVRATGRTRVAELDVRVERYVLPKFEVKLDFAKEWALVGDIVRGAVSATYKFGKPVSGDLEIRASRYVGSWQEYARVTTPIAGKASFEIPPVRYVAGAPDAGGLGQIRLDVTVREQATASEESTGHLVSIASSPINL